MLGVVVVSVCLIVVLGKGVVVVRSRVSRSVM